MPRLSQLGALRLIDPTQWKKKIRAAMNAANGRVGAAAEALEVSQRQLFRWLAEDELKDIKRAETGLPLDGHRGRRKVETVQKIPSRRRASA